MGSRWGSDQSKERRWRFRWEGNAIIQTKKGIIRRRPRAMKIVDLAYILIVEERVYAEELDEGYEKDESGEAQIFGNL